MNARRYTWYQFTDLSDAAPAAASRSSGTMGENAAEFTTSTAGRAISIRCSASSASATSASRNIGRVRERQTRGEKDDLLRTSLFRPRIRPLHLCRIFGGMPISTRAPRREWDMAFGRWETYCGRAEGFRPRLPSASSPPRWDAAPGTEGHLTSSDRAYPNGVAAVGR